RKIISGIELLIAKKLEKISVKLVRSGFRRRVKRPSRSGIFGRVRVGFDVEFAKRVDGSLNIRATLVFLGDIRAIEQEHGHLPADAVNDISVTFSGRTSCVFPVAPGFMSPGDSWANFV